MTLLQADQAMPDLVDGLRQKSDGVAMVHQIESAGRLHHPHIVQAIAFDHMHGILGPGAGHHPSLHQSRHHF